MGRPYRGATASDKGDPGADRLDAVSTGAPGAVAGCGHGDLPGRRAPHRGHRPRPRRPRRPALAGRLGPLRHRPRRRVELGRSRAGLRPGPAPVRQRRPGRGAHALGRRGQRLPRPVSWPPTARAPTTSPSRWPTWPTPSSRPGPFGIEPIGIDMSRPGVAGGVPPPEGGHRRRDAAGRGSAAVDQPATRRLPHRPAAPARRLRVRARRPPSCGSATWWPTSTPPSTSSGPAGRPNRGRRAPTAVCAGWTCLAGPARRPPGGRRRRPRRRTGRRVARWAARTGPPPGLRGSETLEACPGRDPRHLGHRPARRRRRIRRCWPIPPSDNAGLGLVLVAGSATTSGPLPTGPVA